MFAAQIATAIDGAQTLAQLDQLSRLIWQGFDAQAVTDDQAQTLAEAIHARRGLARALHVPAPRPAGRPSIFPPRRPQIAPDRHLSRSRRRQLAASGPLPPALAAHFTMGEMAVLRIVSDEVRQNGVCGRSLAEIAARAGCGRTTAQNAIRQAAKLGLVTVQERRRDGDKNLTNVVRVVSREWVAWLARAGRSPSSSIGFKTVGPTDTKTNKPAFRIEKEAAWTRQDAGLQAGKYRGRPWQMMG